MIKARSNAMTDSDWNVSFWFAVLSPVLGMLISRPSPGRPLKQRKENEWTRYLQLRRRAEPHTLEIAILTIPGLTTRGRAMASMATALCEVPERFVPECLLPQRRGRCGRSQQFPA